MSWADHLRNLHPVNPTQGSLPISASAAAVPSQQEHDSTNPLPGADKSLEDTRWQWLAIQQKLASQVILNDRYLPFRLPIEDPTFCKVASEADPSWTPPDYTLLPHLPPLTLIGGVDISFVDGTDLAVASIAVFSFPEMKLLGTLMHHCTMKLPYICTFLAFREAPPIEALLDQLHATQPHLFPQMLFLDGNGYHHPRHCGVACHLGVLRGIPTIGVAKDLLAVKGITRESVAAALEAIPSGRVKMVALTTPECPLWGHVALTGNSTKKPIYISPGHLVSFAAAAALTWLTCKVRIPEPIRQADLLSRAYIKTKLSSQGSGSIAAPCLDAVIGAAAVAR